MREERRKEVKEGGRNRGMEKIRKQMRERDWGVETGKHADVFTAILKLRITVIFHSEGA